MEMDDRTKIDPLADHLALIASNSSSIGVRNRTIDSPTAWDGCWLITIDYGVREECFGITTSLFSPALVADVKITDRTPCCH